MLGFCLDIPLPKISKLFRRNWYCRSFLSGPSGLCQVFWTDFLIVGYNCFTQVQALQRTNYKDVIFSRMVPFESLLRILVSAGLRRLLHQFFLYFLPFSCPYQTTKIFRDLIFIKKWRNKDSISCSKRKFQISSWSCIRIVLRWNFHVS